MRRGWRFASPPAPANRKRYNLRRLCGGYCDLLQALTGYQPSTDIDAGVGALVEWRRNDQLFR